MYWKLDSDFQDMAKFCSECGAQLPALTAKFCPECGSRIQTSDSELSVPRPTTPPAPSSASEVQELEDVEPVKLNIYDLGVKLEETVAAIFQTMGYSIEIRKRLPTKSGATAEIDILLRRGSRIKAVECKNYDESRAVGVSDLRVFKSKLEETGVFAGVFVTNTSFSEDAEKLADSVGIELWDGDTTREKFFAYKIGRTRNPSLVQDPVLPINTDFFTASALSVRNSGFVKLFSARLLYHPYVIVKYRLQARRSDPTGRSHLIEDKGTYFVDALDGDIINREKSLIEGIGTFFKTREERRQSKEEKWVSEDLSRIEAVTRPVLSTKDYEVSVAEPDVTEADAVDIVRFHVIKKNTKNLTYQAKVRGEYEIRQLKVVPRKNEVSIRGTKLVYVPKWNLEYEAGERTFSKEILASSGRVLVDDLARCSTCTVLRKPSFVVCEVCGIPLCEKHSYNEGRWLCFNHVSDGFREQIKSTGLLSRLGIRRAE
ncbi:MAG: restriction endonuclease [Thermoplasmata archaeon]